MSNEEKSVCVMYFMEALKDCVYKFKRENSDGYYMPCSINVGIFPIAGSGNCLLCLNGENIGELSESKINEFGNSIYAYFSYTSVAIVSDIKDGNTFTLSTSLGNWLQLIDRYENALYNVSESVK